jgi:hypothetical protein
MERSALAHTSDQRHGTRLLHHLTGLRESPWDQSCGVAPNGTPVD